MVLSARSRHEIIYVNVPSLFDGPERCGLALDRLRQQQVSGKSEHQRLMEQVRDQGRKLPQLNLWAADIAKSLGHELNQQQAISLGNALDAAYCYDKELYALGTSGYNFDRHQSDWVDQQQLIYLCDPHLFLLTDDNRLQKRVGKSSQKDRLLDLRGFLKQQGFTPRH